MTGKAIEPRRLSQDRDPWTKQPWESWKAFDAFVRFRDMGPTRTLRRVAETIAELDSRDRSVDAVAGQLSNWSTKNMWRERLEAFELDEDRRRLETRQELQERIVREDVESASKLLRVADHTLDLLEETGAPIGPNEVARYIETASRVRRISAGMSTDNVRQQLTITTADLGRVVNAILVGACERGFVPPERQEEFVRWAIEEAAA